MYSDKLEELISLAIQDGELTEQWRNLIMRRAEKEKEDVEEVMMVVEARLKNLMKKTKSSEVKEKPKKKSSRAAKSHLDTNSVNEETFDYQNVKVFDGLIEHLKMNLEFQRRNPKEIVYTMCHPEKEKKDDLDNSIMYGRTHDSAGDGVNYGILTKCWYFWETLKLDGVKPCSSLDVVTALGLRISNCELDWFDGTPPFDYILTDDDARLMLKVAFWGHEKYKSLFMVLPFFEKFKCITHETVDGDVLYQYFIDCGDNVQLMAAVYTTVLNRLYGINICDLYWNNFFTKIAFNDNEKTGYFSHIREFGLYKPFEIITDNCLFPYRAIYSKCLVPERAVDKISEMADTYNEKYSNGENFILYKKERMLLLVPWRKQEQEAHNYKMDKMNITGKRYVNLAYRMMKDGTKYNNNFRGLLNYEWKEHVK